MTANLQRRKAVIARSVKLGHCVCDPLKACPCDVFKRVNVCQCAGEKMPVKAGGVALTRRVHKAGCASKIGQADLMRILGGLPPVTDPNVLLGTAAGDDAGVYRLDDHCALVQTVDVFTPCVDDPRLFGRIAAANSLSDVYAMGGRPLTALSIIGFPIDDLDGSIMEAMLRGGMEKLEEAGCALIGGHSINDPEIKCGFAITGLIETRRVIQRDRARPGDVLVLTKPLGTGIISFAAQLGRADADSLDAIGRSMETLNKDAAELMAKYEGNACTDVTGFGLAGHLLQMVQGSGVSAEIDLSRVPVFAAAKTCIEEDMWPGAVERNQEYAMAWVQVDDPGVQRSLPILYDPQTSGGLLISLPEIRARKLVEELHARGHEAAAVIGRIIEKTSTDTDGKIIVTNSKLENLVGKRGTTRRRLPTRPAADMTFEKGASTPPAPNEAEPGCCAEVDADARASALPAASDSRGTDSLALFTQFMKESNQAGCLDARTKELIAIALSVVQRCEPCLKTYAKAAFAMGLSLAEIDEAANLAVAFGGCTAMTFYRALRETLPP